ncbi:MAG TPA: hypothetical protein VEX13_14930 [Chloroflexia bacterium]|nr:hypothetical protein [Chloroflexia bacterium]
MPSSFDGWIWCLSLPAVLGVLLVWATNQPERAHEGDFGLGNCLWIVLWGIVMFAVIGRYMSGGTYRGTELEVMPPRVATCFLAWAVFVFALIALGMLGPARKAEPEDKPEKSQQPDS